MKTILTVAIATALLAIVWARAQFVSAQPPTASPGGVPTAEVAAPPVQSAADAPIISAGAPVALPPGYPPAGAPSVVPMPPGYAPATQKGRPGKLVSIPGFGAPGQPAAAPQTVGQMLRESELKVMSRHYEGVLQRALEAEEKAIGASPSDKEIASYRERAMALRNYAEHLQKEIATKAAEPVGGGAPPIGTGPGEALVPGSGAPDATGPFIVGGGAPAPTEIKVVTAFPATNGTGNLNPNNTSETNVAVLEAQIRAQEAALATEEVGLEEALEDMKRAQGSFAQKVISAEEMSRKEFAVKKFKARLQQMKAEIDITQAKLVWAKGQPARDEVEKKQRDMLAIEKDRNDTRTLVLKLEGQFKQVMKMKPEELLDALRVLGTENSQISKWTEGLANATAEEAKLLKSGVGEDDPRLKSARVEKERYLQELSNALNTVRQSLATQLEIQRKNLAELEDLLARYPKLFSENNGKAAVPATAAPSIEVAPPPVAPAPVPLTPPPTPNSR